MSPFSLAASIALALILWPRPTLAGFHFLQVQAARPECSDSAGKRAVCPEQGFSYQPTTAGQTDFQFFGFFGYREVDAKKFGARRFGFVDAGIGIRWFPRSATIWLGSRHALRATVASSAAVGFGANATDFPLDVSAGLAASGLAPKGMMLEGFYRMNNNRALVLPRKGDISGGEKHLTADPHAGARLSAFF